MIRIFNLLLIEDSLADAGLVRMAIEKITANVRLEVIRDGADAIARLKREGAYQNHMPPDLILLDLNLPGRNGKDVLSAIKHDAVLRATPVVILTSSDDQRDVAHAYDMGANSYVTKPVELTEFMKAVAEIMSFWTMRTAMPAVAYRGDR